MRSKRPQPDTTDRHSGGSALALIACTYAVVVQASVRRLSLCGFSLLLGLSANLTVGESGAGRYAQNTSDPLAPRLRLALDQWWGCRFRYFGKYLNHEDIRHVSMVELRE
jgi:hypothetical protein